MRVAVIVAWHVWMVVAACLSGAGHVFGCVEKVPARRARIAAGAAPFHEPGLSERVALALAHGRLHIAEDPALVVGSAEVVFVAVGTPPGPDGRPDMTGVLGAVAELAPLLAPGASLVLKSTVPVGAADGVRALLAARERQDVHVLSNPEFLAEGDAVRGFLEPDRVVIGAASAKAASTLVALYRTVVPDATSILLMDNRSAELAKYAANAMLAARVSLINEIAGLCEATGADIERVRDVVGSDVRIGERYLRAGAGFGGSCFPKDLLALEALGAETQSPTTILAAVRHQNEAQRLRPYKHLVRLLGDHPVAGAKIAVWGLAFKPGTDDLRESPAVAVIERLLSDGAEVIAWDAVAIPAARQTLDPRIRFVDDPMGAADGADAVLLMTEWPELRAVDLHRLARRVRLRIFVDGRNVFDPAALDAAGLVWSSMGRLPSRATHRREGS